MDLNGLKKSLAKVDVYDSRGELGYRAKRGSLSFLARRTADMVSGLAEGGADIFALLVSRTVGGVLKMVVGAEAARNLGAFAGTLGNRILGMLGVGLAAGISAGFAQMDYIHQKENIKDLYKDELAARLDKSPKDVTVKDMESLAPDIPVLDQQLQRARKQRNMNVPLAVLATLASFAMVTIALPALLPEAALAGIGGLLVKGLVSLATYYSVKKPLEALGSKNLGLDKDIASDRIFDLKLQKDKGVDITPEQVLAVFAAANSRLDETVQQQFGKNYDALPAAEQAQLVAALKDRVPAGKLAHDINCGAIKVTELAFAATGQYSGVEREDKPECAPEQDKHKSFVSRLGSRETGHAARLEQQAETTPRQHI